VIKEQLPRGLYRVELEAGGTVTASLESSFKKIAVRLLPGDRVTLEISPLDPTRARITARESTR
jgi:translation initiation factor IF-1